MQRCFKENQVAIRVNLNPLKATTAFPCLGRTITYNNSDWVALCSNLCKSKRRWGVVEKVLSKTGAPIKVRAMMYKTVVQEVLLYGREIWVVIGAMITLIEVFNHRISIQIVVITASNVYSKEWEFTLVDTSLDITRLLPIKEYVRRRQETITEYVAGRPIYKYVQAEIE